MCSIFLIQHQWTVNGNKDTKETGGAFLKIELFFKDWFLGPNRLQICKLKPLINISYGCNIHHPLLMSLHRDSCHSVDTFILRAQLPNTEHKTSLISLAYENMWYLCFRMIHRTDNISEEPQAIFIFLREYMLQVTQCHLQFLCVVYL